MAARPVDSHALLEERLASFISGAPGGDFEAMLMAVFEFQKSANPAYGRFCAQYPPPATWRDIPAVPQQVFKHTALRCFPESDTIRTFRTSGTTGEGFGQHHFKSLRLYELAVRQGWKHARLPHPVDLCLMPPPSQAPYSSLSQMAEWLIGDGKAFLIENGKLDFDVLKASTGRRRVIFGTALAFLNVVESSPSGGLPLGVGSVLVETGGYKGSGRDISRGHLHKLLEATFGAVTIYNEYGMTELTSQFYAGPDGIHRNPPWARVVVIDPVSGRPVEEGETGIVKIFDAANLGSVCAVLTQDLAICLKEGFQLLGRDPSVLPRGCSRAADEMLRSRLPGG